MGLPHSAQLNTLFIALVSQLKTQLSTLCGQSFHDIYPHLISYFIQWTCITGFCGISTTKIQQKKTKNRMQLAVSWWNIHILLNAANSKVYNPIKTSGSTPVNFLHIIQYNICKILRCSSNKTHWYIHKLIKKNFRIYFTLG